MRQVHLMPLLLFGSFVAILVVLTQIDFQLTLVQLGIFVGVYFLGNILFALYKKELTAPRAIELTLGSAFIIVAGSYLL